MPNLRTTIRFVLTAFLIFVAPAFFIGIFGGGDAVPSFFASPVWLLITIGLAWFFQARVPFLQSRP
jgi:hypothetical protein